MPRNGAGTAIPPAGNPVVAGTTINTTWGNDTVNDIYNELSNSIAKDGQTVVTANLPMAGYRLTNVGDALALTQNPSIKQLQNQAATYVSTIGGTANAVTLTPAFLPLAYTSGQRYTFIPASSNTGAATVNVNSLGAKSIKRPDGSALSAGDLTAAGMADIAYDGTNFVLLVGQGMSSNLISAAVAAHVAASSPTTNHSKDPHGDRTYSDYKGIDVRTYGGTSGGSTAANTTALNAAITAAQANGSNRVYIPFDSWTVTDNTEMDGCILAGNGVTALTGAVGYSRLEDIHINGINQSYTSTHPVIPFDRAPKMITRIDANTLWALVEKPSSGYSYLIMKDNVTTAGSDSLAATTGDATQYRVTQVYDAVECLSAYLTASGSNGTWNASSLSTDLPTYDSGTDFDYKYSSSIGAWYQMTVTVPLDGFLSVGFLESSGSSSDVTITVDGVAVDSHFTLVSATTRRVIRTYTVKPGTRDVKITNNTAGSTRINLLGCYFARLKDQRNDVALDSFGIYRLSTNINPLDSSSANDCVVKDYNSEVSGTPGIYGGSYHGGESSISTALFVDGVATTLSVGDVKVGRGIEFQQSSTITWSGSKPGCTYSGSTVSYYSRMVMLVGGYAWQSTVTGAITVKEIHTTLFGVNVDFDAITTPEYKALSTITDGAFYPVGQNNAVEYYYASTGQRLRITHSLHSCPDSKNGGSYIWRVASGLSPYCKYYSPWVWRGKRDITSITGLNIVQAS